MNTPCQDIQKVADTCVDCSLCVKQCGFLSEHGSPRELAHLIQTRPDSTLAFQCSLCRLCTAVCPKGVDPAGLFMGQRCQLVRQERGTYRQHQPLLAYERRGSSRLLSYYGLPDGCDTVFFPGCALPGTRPHRVLDVVAQLKKDIPSLGVILDCCSKPSHDLGRLDTFQTMFFTLHAFLKKRGIRRVLVACPNCYRMFAEYGELEVQTIYELLQAPERASHQRQVTIHDPCGVRFDTHVHAATRRLVDHCGLTITEMKHHGLNTLCCGEGGAVGYLDKELARSWTAQRAQEAGELPVITYCAGCSQFLGSQMECHHLLDLVFAPNVTLAGKTRVHRSPFTYWQRFRLKKKLAAGLAPHSPCSRQEALA